MALKIPLAALTVAVMLAPAAHAEPTPESSESKTGCPTQFSINLPMFRANHLKQ